MHNGNGRGPMSDINITPFVDVMLVLLVIFISVSLSVTHEIGIRLPSGRHGEQTKNSEAGTVFFDKNGTVFYGKTKIGPLSKVEVFFKNLENKPTALSLQADEKLYYGEVVRLLSLLKHLRIANVSLVLTRDTAS